MKIMKIGAILLTMSVFVFAQFSAGTKSISGEVLWSKITYDDGITKQENEIFIANPEISVFLFSNFALNLGINYQKYENEDNDYESESTSYGAGATIFLSGLYLGAGYYDQNIDFDDNTFLIGEGGFLIGLSKNVYLDFGVDYWVGQEDNPFTRLIAGIGVKYFF